MLRACHDLLKPGGRIAFTTIYIASGVSARDYRRASRVRGRGAASRRTATDLLASAGFTDIRERDVTRQFSATTAAYMRAASDHERALRRDWGDGRYEEQQHDRRATLGLIRDGIIRRGMFLALRP